MNPPQPQQPPMHAVHRAHNAQSLRPIDALSARELQVVELIAVGHSNQEICEQLFLSMNTVKTHIRRAYRAIGVTRRTEAVVWAVRHGIVDHDDPTIPDHPNGPDPETGAAPHCAPAASSVPATRMQLVVAALDVHHAQPVAAIAASTGLHDLVVKVALYQLHEHGLVTEGDDDAWVLSDFADELLAARTNTSSTRASTEVCIQCGRS